MIDKYALLYQKVRRFYMIRTGQWAWEPGEWADRWRPTFAQFIDRMNASRRLYETSPRRPVLEHWVRGSTGYLRHESSHAFLSRHRCYDTGNGSFNRMPELPSDDTGIRPVSGIEG